MPDREEVVAEIWYGDEYLAELRREGTEVRVQLYNAPAADLWDVRFDDLLAALQRARVRLG